MKKLLMIIPLVILLCFLLIESTPLHAEEWTAEQKEIVKFFENYMDASNLSWSWIVTK